MDLLGRAERSARVRRGPIPFPTPLVALVAGALACIAFGCGNGADHYRAHGIVHDVQPELGQVLIEHDDIEGLMPAMTMSFAVPDAALMARLRSGQVIDFVLAFDGHSYDVVSVEIVGEGEEGDGWVRFGDARVKSDPIPDFALVDQSGTSVSNASLVGRILLVDFIFTQCPGPCPILTTTHVRVQRALGEALRDRVQLVSISLDPRNDSPEALTRYAESRGAVLDNWSFLTGSPDDIDAVLQAFGVGRTRGEDGEVEHNVITFLVNGDGRIVERYFGLQHEPKKLVRDIEKLAGSGDAS